MIGQFKGDVMFQFQKQNIMNPTSLHTILSRESSPLREDELMYLFSAPRFPRFELHDLLSNNHLLENTRFAFFLQILERWNSKVAGEKPEGTEIEYRKNEFIFSWLKGVAVQNSGNIDSSLQKLYEWYSSNSEHDVVCNVRKENVYRSRLQDWEIRNSYKSNMPLQINNYRRRALFGQQSTNASPQPVPPSEAKSPKEKKAPIMEICKSEGERARKENNFIRGVREERQMGDFLTNYRKTKVNYFKNTTKNFYRKEFSRDKQQKPLLKHIKEKNGNDEHVKSYRIKTALGLRPFEKTTPNSSFSQTAYTQFYKPSLEESSVFGEGSPQKEVRLASKVDGLGLLVNPFEVKPKRKKK